MVQTRSARLTGIGWDTDAPGKDKSVGDQVRCPSIVEGVNCDVTSCHDSIDQVRHDSDSQSGVRFLKAVVQVKVVGTMVPRVSVV